MGKRTIRAAILATALVALAVVGAQPVLADTELGHTGTVGVHSLRDSSSEYGASCKYRYLAAYDFGQLRRIYVYAPRVRAVAGHAAQLVGWKFTIQRRTVWLDGNGPWQNRFTSTEQTATTSDSAYAPFTERSASVDVPFGPGDVGAAAQYRVIVTMLWHRTNGTIQGTARHRVNYYGSYYSNAGGVGMQHNICRAYWAPGW